MVKKTPAMVDMACAPDESADMPMPATSSAPRYPYGLCLCLNDEVLDKLKNLDASTLKIGDILHLFAFARVTSISSNETQDGASRRVELQITHLADENENDDDKPSKTPAKRLYS